MRTFHPDRDHCECDRLGKAEGEECFYNDPCWTSREAYEKYVEERAQERAQADRRAERPES